MFVTYHAATRFAQRIAPEMTRDQARSHLIEAVKGAIPTGKKTDGGNPIWSIRDPDALLVTKRDSKIGDVVVTVLAPDEVTLQPGAISEAEDEVLAAAERAGFGARLPVLEDRWPRAKRRGRRRKK